MEKVKFINLKVPQRALKSNKRKVEVCMSVYAQVCICLYPGVCLKLAVGLVLINFLI